MKNEIVEYINAIGELNDVADDFSDYFSRNSVQISDDKLSGFVQRLHELATWAMDIQERYEFGDDEKGLIDRAMKEGPGGW